MKLSGLFALIACTCIFAWEISCKRQDSGSEKPLPAVSKPDEIVASKPMTAAPSTQHAVTSAKLEGGVEILRVGEGAEGALIAISYKIPPAAARSLRPGNVYVVDEATGTVYREVSVMPVVGPLISHPRTAGQIGSVMLVNAPTPLKKGSIVTVVLGNYKQEHMLMQ